ncbi:SprT family zinc-dependent metalloprotease [Proteinivorax tanatarense]|uniref:SprT family zinc-dependent metalloprotease n=1 Tax=Proteinivorax tanatarense TaxID=1260629 RepID=A0AAU7VML2_9FIRM
MEKHQVKYGEETIEFQLQRKDVKNVNLNIKPDTTVQVSANHKVPDDFIYNFVKGKGSWIKKQQKKFEKVAPQPQSEREYVSGESFKYLGKQYRLKVEQTDEIEQVKYLRGFIHLYVKDKTNHNKKAKLLQNWYRTKAKQTFQKSLDKMYPKVGKYGIKKPNLETRQMKARWGSALIETNIILINKDLIKAPKHCIDYVILHELLHFKNNNHNQDFYQTLNILMPDWEERKKILDEEVVREL